MHQFNFTIYPNTANLPLQWDAIAHENLFLRKQFLEVLEVSQPKNMRCYFVAIFKEKVLVAVAIFQVLMVQDVATFGERDTFLKKQIRDFIFRKFAGNVLFVGNNLLTGQNAYAFKSAIDQSKIIEQLLLATKQLKKENKSIRLTVFKDFELEEDIAAAKKSLPNFHCFLVQPDMIFIPAADWRNEADYVASLSKKYRDQYKRARKKSADIVKKKLSLKEILENQETLHLMYLNVAKNAPFNTFYLSENHFAVLKERLQQDFLLYGYFYKEELIGFNTLMKNGTVLETYFLGYSNIFQREKMLYLNMLYDMIGYAVTKNFQRIIFARTALEIKSSVGSKPVASYGFILHENRFLQKLLPRIFGKLEPKTDWIERNPFNS